MSILRKVVKEVLLSNIIASRMTTTKATSISVDSRWNFNRETDLDVTTSPYVELFGSDKSSTTKKLRAPSKCNGKRGFIQSRGQKGGKS